MTHRIKSALWANRKRKAATVLVAVFVLPAAAYGAWSVFNGQANGTTSAKVNGSPSVVNTVTITPSTTIANITPGGASISVMAVLKSNTGNSVVVGGGSIQLLSLKGDGAAGCGASDELKTFATFTATPINRTATTAGADSDVGNLALLDTLPAACANANLTLTLKATGVV